MKLPLFPLKSIFFPGETVPLHIFEPRYKQLIHDCRKEAITFGIPVYIKNTIAYGTEVQLVEVVTTYDSGAMDIMCVARQVFKVKTFNNQIGDKLYAGGIVEFLEYDYISNEGQKEKVLTKIQELYSMMDIPFALIKPKNFNSFKLAHKIGLSFEQEYELLQIPKEKDRLVFLEKHLIDTLFVLTVVEKTKEAIKLNGHFKNFDPLDFEDLNV
ncbi:LON peptidase substrate-binding domain-containing protein [Maribacter sp. CXY002]|uniref:LON peptidase substrate-binding domain-containing protein n=1 Tax=Maribacter luteocoastalis TaxID=3407671 RepID=UPI003B66D330